MNKRHATLLTLSAALVAVALPILLAIRLADNRSRQAADDRALQYTADALRRSDDMADQTETAILTLARLHAADPCSPASLALMRRFALAFGDVRAVGHVVDNRLVCSSLGRDDAQLDLGPADRLAVNGARLHVNVRFALDPANTYLAVEGQGFAVIINKMPPIDATVDERDVSLGLFMLPGGAVLAARGPIDPRWIRRAPRRGNVTFEDGGRIVAIAASPRHFIGTIAAIPASHLDPATRRMALFLLLLGVMAGTALALAVLHLGRAQTAMPAVIRAALRRREFYLVYQPIVDLHSGAWVGAEALIRWRRANGELVRPDLFIPVAEESQLIGRLTKRVIELVGRDVQGLFGRYPDFHIGINLSAHDLQSEETVEWLRRLAAELHARPGNLTVEATERGFINPALAGRVVGALRRHGLRVAIDDFGTGYSSLAYLESLELDCLKIDRSFVNTINVDAPTSQVILHIIQIASSLKLEMIAEGVETEGQAQFLREHGVRFAQGWHFSKAVSMAELTAALEAQQRTPGAPRSHAA